MPEITDKLGKWRVSAEWFQSKAGWLLKETSSLIDCPYRETVSYAKQPSPEPCNYYLCVVAMQRHKWLQSFVKMLKTTGWVMSIKITVVYWWWTMWHCTKQAVAELRTALFFWAQHGDSLKYSCSLWAVSNAPLIVWIDEWEMICQEVVWWEMLVKKKNILTAFADLIKYLMANFSLRWQKEHCPLSLAGCHLFRQIISHMCCHGKISFLTKLKTENG